MGLPSGSWERVFAFGAGSTASDVAREVVHGRAGFLVMGQRWESAEGGPQETLRSMWLSPDAIAWETVEVPSQVGEGYVEALISTPDGDYVLYYNTPTGEPGSGEWITEALLSSDGRTWDKVETGVRPRTDIDSIERGAQGYLLLGNQVGFPSGNPTVWFSDDGVSWELVHEFNQDTSWAQVTDAGAGDEGFVIFGQRVALDSSSYERFAFASADGLSWETALAPFGPDDPTYRPDVIVAGMGPDWIAAIASKDDSAQFWFSANGLDWEPVGSIEGVGSTMSWDPVLATVEGRLYFSASGKGFPGGVPGAWSSVDGVTWEAIDLGVDAYLGGAAAGSGTIVLSGTELNSADTSVAGVWARTGD